MTVTEDEQPGSGTAIAIGALLDGCRSRSCSACHLLGGGGVGVPVLAGIFISNLPEGLSSTSGMKRSGRSARYVFGVWGGIAAGLRAGRAGRRLAFEDASAQTVALINSIAAGAILAMIADTMIPEAFDGAVQRYQLGPA